jgi:hypothetical protein
MLTDADVKRLIALAKHFVEASQIDFPGFGESLEREVTSDVGHEDFVIDVNRRGKTKQTKCTYQKRYAVTDIIFRLDIDGPPHTNPNGEFVPCPHLHIYREGFADKWAFPVTASLFSDTTKLVKTFREFLSMCNIHDLPEIQAPTT